MQEAFFTKTIIFLPYGIYIKDLNALVTSDYHLGYEEVLYREGIYVPDVQLNKIIKQLKFMRSNTKAEKIYLLGDLKHEFSEFTYSEFTEVRQLIEFLSNEFKEIYLVRGNHDNYIIQYLNKQGFEFHNYIIDEDILFIHGDKSPMELGIDLENEKLKTIIMGHLHPSIVLEDSIKIRRKFKIGLEAKADDYLFYILPGMSFLSYGIEIRELIGSKTWPFLEDKALYDAIPYIMQDDYCIRFPKVSDILKSFRD
ncbi:MAG: metallophosphoesterase [Candidatus Anstonellales archaeon]